MRGRPGRNLIGVAVLAWTWWLLEVLGAFGPVEHVSPTPHLLALLALLALGLDLFFRIAHARASRRARARRFGAEDPDQL